MSELVDELLRLSEHDWARACLIVRFNQPTGEPDWKPMDARVSLADKLREAAAVLSRAEAQRDALARAAEPFAKTGWMTTDTLHTARTVIAHMHPEREYELILSSADFYAIARALAAAADIQDDKG